MSFSGFVTVEVLSFVLFYFFSGKARLHTCVLDRNKKSTNIAFVFLWLLCILFGVFIYAGIFKPAATYPFETLYNKNAYKDEVKYKDNYPLLLNAVCLILEFQLRYPTD